MQLGALPQDRKGQGGKGKWDKGPGKGKGNHSKQQQVHCYNCGKPGHTQANCWSKGQKHSKDKGGKGKKGKTKDAVELMGNIRGSEEVRGVHAHVAQNQKGLMSVSAMVDAGHEVIFKKDPGGRDVSGAVSSDGSFVPFVRRQGIYEIDFAVQQPFQRLGSNL